MIRVRYIQIHAIIGHVAFEIELFGMRMNENSNLVRELQRKRKIKTCSMNYGDEPIITKYKISFSP